MPDRLRDVLWLIGVVTVFVVVLYFAVPALLPTEEALTGTVVEKRELPVTPSYVMVGPYISATGGGVKYQLVVELPDGHRRTLDVSRDLYDSFWVGSKFRKE